MHVYHHNTSFSWAQRLRSVKRLGHTLSALMLALTAGHGFAAETITFQWDQVTYATHYRVVAKPEGGAFETVYTGTLRSADITREEGVHFLKVIGCLVEPGTTDEYLCEEVATYSDEKEVEFGAFLERRVIFIHTDLLGSPAAESYEQGGAQ